MLARTHTRQLIVLALTHTRQLIMLALTHTVGGWGLAVGGMLRRGLKVWMHFLSMVSVDLNPESPSLTLLATSSPNTDLYDFLYFLFLLSSISLNLLISVFTRLCHPPLSPFPSRSLPPLALLPLFRLPAFSPPLLRPSEHSQTPGARE
ncbi:hypothetical protein DPEC_G00362700 [Dallia pectoralis]|nr:hypothetical protein DPEC_G00362700 [Dallia pectoralis]